MKGLVEVKALLLRAAHHGVAQVLGTILFLAGAGIGASLIFQPEMFMNVQVLHENFHWMAPAAWGTLFVVASFLLGVTVWVDIDYAQLPALVLGVVFLVFGFLALLSGITPIVWAFAGLGWVSIFTQIVCWAKGKNAAVLYRNEPE